MKINLALSILAVATAAFVGPQTEARSHLCSTAFLATSDSFINTLPSQQLRSLVSVGRFKKAEYAGQRVFLKPLKGPTEKEFEWLVRLNSWGLGPRVYGKTQIDGVWLIVLEDVSGVNTQLPMAAPLGFRLNHSVIQEMQRQTDLLAAHQVEPLDLQFLISLDRSKVTLIDPEFFSIDPNISPENIRFYLEQILLNWRMDGRIEP